MKFKEVKEKEIKKIFDIVVETRHGSVVIRSVTFDPNVANRYVVRISPNHARNTLVIKAVKNAINSYNDSWLKAIDELPLKLKKQVEKYIDLSLMRGDKEFRETMENVKKHTWKV